MGTHTKRPALHLTLLSHFGPKCYRRDPCIWLISLVRRRHSRQAKSILCPSSDESSEQRLVIWPTDGLYIRQGNIMLLHGTGTRSNNTSLISAAAFIHAIESLLSANLQKSLISHERLSSAPLFPALGSETAASPRDANDPDLRSRKTCRALIVRDTTNK